MMKLCLVAALLVAVVVAQDPAPGWLAYATAECPAGTKITGMEAKWLVGANPPSSFAFFSPWFGIDASDNLNLLQPVNPWGGDSWSMYTEYYQWSPSNNQDSNQYQVNAGDQLFGKVVYNGDADQSYTLTQTDVTSGQSSSMTIPVQQDDEGNYKNFTVMYIVYEKVAQCGQYPPDQKVTFSDIKVKCNDALVSPKWTTSYVEDVCNFRAHVVSPSEVTITWDTSVKDPTPEQFARSAKAGLQRMAPGKTRKMPFPRK
jgi:hypothetical protein